MENILFFISGFLGALGGGLVVDYLKKGEEKKRKYAKVWSYTFGNQVEYRWYCAAENTGSDGFSTEYEAKVDARYNGYRVD